MEDMQKFFQNEGMDLTCSAYVPGDDERPQMEMGANGGGGNFKRA